MLLRNILEPIQISNTRLSLSMVLLSKSFFYPSWSHIGVLQPQQDKSCWFGLFPFRSPLLRESLSLSIPPLTEMFHFSGYRYLNLCIQFKLTGLLPAGFPHSEIPGSKRVCRSPRLIAAYHVLLRLVSPRHSPIALDSLVTIYICRTFSKVF